MFNAYSQGARTAAVTYENRHVRARRFNLLLIVLFAQLEFEYMKAHWDSNRLLEHRAKIAFYSK